MEMELDNTSDMISDIAKKITKEYDDFVFQLLSQYGITPSNIRDYIGRLEIFKFQNDDSYFYLDKKYLFTIKTSIEYPQESDGYSYELKHNLDAVFEPIDYELLKNYKG